MKVSSRDLERKKLDRKSGGTYRHTLGMAHINALPNGVIGRKVVVLHCQIEHLDGFLV